jgi:hypothetical protein
LTTVFVCSDVPDAIFVSTQDASNCNDGLKQTNGLLSAIYQYSMHIHAFMVEKSDITGMDARKHAII